MPHGVSWMTGRTCRYQSLVPICNCQVQSPFDATSSTWVEHGEVWATSDGKCVIIFDDLMSMEAFPKASDVDH